MRGILTLSTASLILKPSTTYYTVRGHAWPRHRSARSSSFQLVMKGGTCQVWTQVFCVFFTKLARNVGYYSTAARSSELPTLPRESDPSSLTSPNLILSSAALLQDASKLRILRLIIFTTSTSLMIREYRSGGRERTRVVEWQPSLLLRCQRWRAATRTKLLPVHLEWY